MTTTQHDDQLVTHSDLPAIRDLTSILQATRLGERSRVRMEDLLARLVQLATADLPPLPDGWVLRDGATAHYYRDQALFTSPAGTQMTYTPDETLALRVDGHLQPLVAVDGAGLERAAIALAISGADVSDRTSWPHWASEEGVQQAWLAHARRVLETAGISVVQA